MDHDDLKLAHARKRQLDKIRRIGGRGNPITPRNNWSPYCADRFVPKSRVRGLIRDRYGNLYMRYYQTRNHRYIHGSGCTWGAHDWKASWWQVHERES